MYKTLLPDCNTIEHVTYCLFEPLNIQNCLTYKSILFLILYSITVVHFILKLQ